MSYYNITNYIDSIKDSGVYLDIYIVNETGFTNNPLQDLLEAGNALKKMYLDTKFYSYLGIKNKYITDYITKQSDIKQKNQEIESLFIVKLGGPFLKIGDDDESLGGDNSQLGKYN
jgi:hypothetical protein